MPSSFCGLYGLRPTHGRIALDGILLQAPSFDTIGWFARDAATFARVGRVLLQSEGEPGHPRHVVIAQDAFEIADATVSEALQPYVELLIQLVGSSSTQRLSPTSLFEWSNQQQTLQGREAWETARDWLDRVNPRLSFEVGDRYATARNISDAEVAAAQSVRETILGRMAEVLVEGTFVVLPTTATPAPLVKERLSTRGELRPRNSALTSIAGITGSPQINLPMAEVDGLPIGLSLIGSRGSDELLLGFAQEVAAAAGQ